MSQANFFKALRVAGWTSLPCVILDPSTQACVRTLQRSALIISSGSAQQLRPSGAEQSVAPFSLLANERQSQTQNKN
jgi:hypothetical protein